MTGQHQDRLLALVVLWLGLVIMMEKVEREYTGDWCPELTMDELLWFFKE